jgi:hypothetical protein
MKKECINYLETAFADDENQRSAFMAHCKECSECASLASDWARLRNIAIPASEVPIALDFAILSMACNAASVRSRRKVTVRRIIYYGAAAACLAIACLVTVFPPSSEKRMSTKDIKIEIVKSWDWSKFDKEVFETDASIEISKNLMSVSGKPEEPSLKLLIAEEDQEQI